MEFSFNLNDLLLFQVAMAAIFSPFAVIGPYSALTDSFSRKTQRKIAFRVSVYTALFLIITAWAGELILKVLGISIGALAAAGGLVLILTSLPMIMKGESPRRKVKTDDEGELDHEWASMVVSPLVFPLTMGAGSISLVIHQASQVESIGDRFGMTVVLLIHGLVVFATYFLSVPLAGKMGGRGSAVVTRIGGIILLSLAFIIFTNGLKALLPGLG
jgi:multiple antibiotic resistance protein